MRQPSRQSTASDSKGLRAFVPSSFSRRTVPVQEAPPLTFLHPGRDQRANPERENSLPSAGKPWSHPRHKARLRLRLPSCESSPVPSLGGGSKRTALSAAGPPHLQTAQQREGPRQSPSHPVLGSETTKVPPWGGAGAGRAYSEGVARQPPGANRLASAVTAAFSV